MDYKIQDYAGVLGNSHFFSSRLVNEFRFQFANRDYDALPADPLGPEVTINGVAALGRDFYVPSTRNEKRWQWLDNMTVVAGKHDIKFGVQYTKGRGNWMGGYFQNSVNFLYPQRWTQSVANMQSWYGDTGLMFYNNKDTLNPFLTVRTADSMGAFFDDQWSIGTRLTLNLGARFARANGFIPEQCRSASDPPLESVFTLSYVGAMYDAHSPQQFLHSVQELLRTSPDLRGRFRVRLVGAGAAKVAARVRELRLLDTIEVRDQRIAGSDYKGWIFQYNHRIQ